MGSDASGQRGPQSSEGACPLNHFCSGGPIDRHVSTTECRFFLRDGGGKGIRTPDLLIANETLYQLSYTPTKLDENSLRCFH
jgi:hypothetical protein